MMLARRPVQLSTAIEVSCPMVDMPTGIAKMFPAKPVIPLIRYAKKNAPQNRYFSILPLYPSLFC